MNYQSVIHRQIKTADFSAGLYECNFLEYFNNNYLVMYQNILGFIMYVRTNPNSTSSIKCKSGRALVLGHWNKKLLGSIIPAFKAMKGIFPTCCIVEINMMLDEMFDTTFPVTH